MTEDEARSLAATIVDKPTMVRLGRLVELVVAENENQNLVSKASASQIWCRHILDSLQLVRFVPSAAETWIDIGTGAGFPGLVVAALARWRVTLVEPRTKRATFLNRSLALLDLRSVCLLPTRAETVAAAVYDVVSARAVASLTDVLTMTRHLAGSNTTFVFPKGRTANGEVELARRAWRGSFHVEPSITEPTAGIILAHGLEPR